MQVASTVDFFCRDDRLGNIRLRILHVYSYLGWKLAVEGISLQKCRYNPLYRLNG